MAKVSCIDVSSWQTNIDYNKVKASGITAVIIRAGYGREVSQKDTEFETHYKKAKSAGLKIGAYWYSYATSVADAKKEASACLACIKGKSFDLPVYFDMEESSQSAYGKTTLTNMATAFCDAVKSGGYRAGVYANLNWFNNYLDYNKLKSKYSIWLAQYYKTNELQCDIWQNASTGKIDGINGNVDTNIIFNTDVISAAQTAAANSAASSASKKVQTCTVTMAYVGKGYSYSKGQVLTLQRILNELKDGSGYRGKDGKKLTLDGVFGDNAEHALKEFQKVHSLTADGIVGKKTWSVLLSEYKK